MKEKPSIPPRPSVQSSNSGTVSRISSDQPLQRKFFFLFLVQHLSDDETFSSRFLFQLPGRHCMANIQNANPSATAKISPPFANTTTFCERFAVGHHRSEKKKKSRNSSRNPSKFLCLSSTRLPRYQQCPPYRISPDVSKDILALLRGNNVDHVDRFLLHEKPKVLSVVDIQWRISVSISTRYGFHAFQLFGMVLS